MSVCVRLCVGVRACVCVRARVCVCVRVCVRARVSVRTYGRVCEHVGAWGCARWWVTLYYM